MKELGVFEFRDEGLDADEVEDIINEKLKELKVDADDVVSVMQPSGYAITRVLYRKKA